MTAPSRCSGSFRWWTWPRCAIPGVGIPKSCNFIDQVVFFCARGLTLCRWTKIPVVLHFGS
jgi:hypothetical protein